MYKRTLIGFGNYSRNEVTRKGYENYPKIRITDGLNYKDDDISGYASARPVATKMKHIYGMVFTGR